MQCLKKHEWFKLAWTKSMKSYCTTPGVSDRVGGGAGVSKMLKFYVMYWARRSRASYPILRQVLFADLPQSRVWYCHTNAPGVRRASCVSFASVNMKEIYIRSNIQPYLSFYLSIYLSIYREIDRLVAILYIFIRKIIIKSNCKPDIFFVYLSIYK